MPLPRQSQGRPGTVVIPAGWGESHGTVVDKTHQSLVRIGPAGGTPTRNPGTRQMETAAAAPVYVGAASLMLVSDAARALTVVEDPVTSRVYDVTLPYAASGLVAVDHVVTVDGTDPDPMLAGKRLTVSAIERGTRRFSRLLLAVLLD